MEQGGGVLAGVLVVHPLGAAGAHRQRGAHFGEQLLGSFIQIDLRAGGVMGPAVHFQHVFHGGDELGVGLGREAPTLLSATA